VAEKLKQAALQSLHMALRPVARMMLRNGVTAKEAQKVMARAFVEIARQEYGVHGRPTNISRIAILTGLSRRDVRRLLDEMEESELPALNRMNRATQVLTGWHTDADFVAPDGAPQTIAYDDGDAGFTELCRRYAGDIPPTAMLKELERVGAIVATDADHWRAAMRYYMPDSQDPDALLRTGSVLEDLGATAAHNLNRSGDAATRFEGRATNINIRASAVRPWRAWLESEAQAFLERADDWLTRHERKEGASRPERAVRIGLGLYQIHDDGKRHEDDEND